MINVKTDPLLTYYNASATTTFSRYDDGYWCIFSPFGDLSLLGSAPFAVREDKLSEFVSPGDIDRLLKELEDYKHRPY